MHRTLLMIVTGGHKPQTVTTLHEEYIIYAGAGGFHPCEERPRRIFFPAPYLERYRWN